MKDFDHKLRVFKTVVQQGPFTQIIVQDSHAKYVDWCRGTRGQGGGNGSTGSTVSSR